ncbi:MAG: MCE family protein [Kiritimatiellae bacterium]|nr:MCE family protein [Kiritimatiellia bacterium]
MATPFKFRNVNLLAGIFVLAALVLLGAGILVAGRSQKWFQPSVRIQVRFPSEGTFGIEQGAKVVVLGARAGEVERIAVDESETMRGVLKLDADYARFIRSDTRALVKKTLGVAGDSFIDILVGTGAPVDFEASETPPEIPIDKDTELLELAQSAIDQIREAVLPGLKELELTLAEYRGMAADLRSAQGPLITATDQLKSLLAEIQKTVEGLNRGEGTAGLALKDPAAYQQVLALMNQLNTIAERVAAISADVQAATARLPAMAEQVEGEVRELPGTVLQTQGALREAERTLQGVQRHWLLRRYVEEAAPLEAAPAATLARPPLTGDQP